MRTEDFHKLLDDPRSIEGHLVDDLKVLAARHPYSQIVQLMYGLRLRTSSEHLFNQQLGKTAVLTNDRAVLFELFENKTPTINKGVSTIEVEQSPATLAAPEVAEKEPEVLPLKVEEQRGSGTPVAPALSVEGKVEDIPSKEATSSLAQEQAKPEEKPKEEKVEEESQAMAAAQEPRKVELPSATPENLADLSPAERVQAILKRNRELRAQFDANKSGEGEKLWEAKKEEKASETLPESTSVNEEITKSNTEPEPRQEALDTSLENDTQDLDRIDAENRPIASIEDKLDDLELAKQENTANASADESGAPIKEDLKEKQPEETVDHQAILDKIKGAELENDVDHEASVEAEQEEIEPAIPQESAQEFTEMASEQGVNEEEEKKAEEDKEPWADSPIDIEALIRRRFARRFEREAEEENEYDPWEEETESEPSEIIEPPVNLEIEKDQDETVIVDSAAEQISIAPQEEKPADTSAVFKQKENLSEDENPPSESFEGAKSDLALAVRIRMIRERLEGLKGNDGISREELEILMEEHRQLENLMADLPLDEDQLFEVELEANTASEEKEESPTKADEDLDADYHEIDVSSSSELITTSPEDEDLKEETQPQELEATEKEEPSFEEDLLEKESNSSELEQEISYQSSGMSSHSLKDHDPLASENEFEELVEENVQEVESKEEVQAAVFEIEKEIEARDEQTESDHEEDLVQDTWREAEEPTLEPEGEIEAETTISESEEHILDNRAKEAISDQEERQDILEESSSSISRAENDSSDSKIKEEQPTGEAKEEKAEEVKKEEPQEKEDLDSEIARIEALAAELRGGRNRDMSQNDINSMREQRMNEMIEQRKKDLEIKESDETAETENPKGEKSQEEAISPVPESEAKSEPSLEQEEDATSKEENPQAGEDKNELDSEQTVSLEKAEADISIENSSEADFSQEENTASVDLTTVESSAKIEQEIEEEITEEVAKIEEELPSFPLENANEEISSESKAISEAVDAAEESLKETKLEEVVGQGPELTSEENSAKGEEEVENEASFESETGSGFSDWLKKVSGGVNADQPKEEENDDSSEKTISNEDNAELDKEPELTDSLDIADSNRDKDEPPSEAAALPKQEIAEKIDLLDSFVEKLPDLKKKNRDAKTSANLDSTSVERPESEGSGMVTETLAKVYIRQKHYKKAIQAYEILMLKYPEKSSFFASQISEIKKLANSK